MSAAICKAWSKHTHSPTQAHTHTSTPRSTLRHSPSPEIHAPKSTSGNPRRVSTQLIDAIWCMVFRITKTPCKCSARGSGPTHHSNRSTCHVMPCHVMPCHAMSRHVTPHATSRPAMSCRVVSCHVTLCHIMSCLAMSCPVLSCHAMSCCVVSRRVAS